MKDFIQLLLWINELKYNNNNKNKKVSWILFGRICSIKLPSSHRLSKVFSTANTINYSHLTLCREFTIPNMEMLDDVISGTEHDGKCGPLSFIRRLRLSSSRAVLHIGRQVCSIEVTKL